jgi:ribosomal protein S18 acetylase RimI-like enzyme
MRAALDNPNGAVVVCIDGGEVAGVMIYEIVDKPATDYSYASRSLHIDEFGVAKKHRRKGCGEMLIDAAVEAAKASGVNRITLQVFAFNEGARAFYERMGFAPMAIRMAREL